MKTKIPNWTGLKPNARCNATANDLQRIIGTLAQRYLPRRSPPSPLTWRRLIELEEQAFSDLGFQARHDQAIIDAFLRLRDSRLPGLNIDEAVNLRCDDDYLPAVYLIVEGRSRSMSDFADGAHRRRGERADGWRELSAFATVDADSSIISVMRIDKCLP